VAELRFIASANVLVARFHVNWRVASQLATLSFQPSEQKAIIGGSSAMALKKL
jgi:hypothetical protein